MKDVIKQMLEEKINEVFAEQQKIMGITSGEISPLHSLRLEELEDKMTDLIQEVLDSQCPQFNMTATLEVLEDFHSLKKGEIVFAVDNTDKEFVIERGIELLYAPQNIFRMI